MDLKLSQQYKSIVSGLLIGADELGKLCLLIAKLFNKSGSLNLRKTTQCGFPLVRPLDWLNGLAIGKYDSRMSYSITAQLMLKLALDDACFQAVCLSLNLSSHASSDLYQVR